MIEPKRDSKAISSDTKAPHVYCGKVHSIMTWSQDQDSYLNFALLNVVTLGKSFKHSLYQFIFYNIITISKRVMRINWHNTCERAQ